MSDTILSGDFTIYYLDENRQKRIDWTGSTAKSDVEKMVTVYDATEDLFTVPTQQNDGLIFSAETPGEYTIGLIDAGELEPWFISLKTMEHVIGDFANFTGCALKTSGWKRVLPGDGTENIGIMVVPVTSGGAIVIGDVGLDISHADGDAGTLLDVIVTGGSLDYLWIRPDTNALADDFNSASGNLTCNAHISVQDSAGITGEMVWGNFYTQGALVTDTHVFALQNAVKVTSSDETDQDWWTDGQVDRAIPITDYTTTDFPIIDEGFLTIKADQYASKYTYAIIRMNTTSGGNVSAGLSSGADGTNTTGYASITVSGGSGNFTVGDEIEDDSNGARGILTQIDNPGATATYHYYLVGDPLVDFDGGAITNNDDTGAATGSAAPVNQGPALTTWFDGNAFPTYAFGNDQFDIDDDTVNEEYSLVIDLNQASLAQMHEYNKFAKSRGSAIQLDGIDGEQWIGFDYALFYSAFTTTIAEGDIATQQNTLATGTVVSFPGGTNNVVILRNSRGTFNDTDQIDFTSGGNISGAQLTSVEVIVPVAESSFGTLAGVNYFASRSVRLFDYKAGEENLFSLITAFGVPIARPTSISVSFLNLKQYDVASIWRLTGTGGIINKTEYSATGGETAGGATLTVDGSIAADVPGKALGSHLVLMDVSDDNQEYVIRFDDYVTSSGLVNFSDYAVAAADSATTTNIQETGAFSTALVGDLVYNNGNGHDGVSYISEVVGANEVNVYPPIPSQTTGDNIDFNVIPYALVDTADQVFFAIIFEFRESDGTSSASMQYVGDFFGRGVVRNQGVAPTKIKGFTTEIPITTSGGAGTATRIPNTVYGS